MDDKRSDETLIYFDKSTLIARMIMGIVVAAAFTYLLIVLKHDYSEGFIVTVCFALFAYFIIFKHIYLLIAHQPQIIINTMGVRLPPAELDTWDKIGNIKLERINKVRSEKILLTYKVSAEDGNTIYREIDFADLDTNKILLKELLNNYRLQFYVHTKQEIIPLPGLSDEEE